MIETPDGYMGMQDAAYVLKVSLEKIRGWVSAGSMKSYTSGRVQYVFKESILDQALALGLEQNIVLARLGELTEEDLTEEEQREVRGNPFKPVRRERVFLRCPNPKCNKEIFFNYCLIHGMAIDECARFEVNGRG